jgi:hypothetical protein
VQKEIQGKGLPESLRDRFRAAGFSDQQIQESQRRILESDAESVRKFVIQHRHNLMNAASQTPEWYVASLLVQSARIALGKKPMK